uniref:Protein NRT1/ PTR FAMILY 4.6 n=1 Tax=Ananas comosus var. bracteatus TaxID=296719 RepID=A0A6V7NUZ8_ANACO|nr:unnamed protein product [Ananas comosus var. bracteatus]
MEMEQGHEQERWEGYVDWRNKPALKAKHGGMVAASFVLVVEVMENLAFLANASNLVTYLMKWMRMSPSRAATTVTNFMGTAFLLALLGGFLSDAILSTYLVYLISALVEFLGLLVLTIQAKFPSLQPQASGGAVAMLFAGLYVTALGVGGIKGSLPTHGAEQFDGDSERGRRLRSTFFNYFVFCLSAGGLIAVTFVVWVEDNKGIADLQKQDTGRKSTYNYCQGLRGGGAERPRHPEPEKCGGRHGATEPDRADQTTNDKQQRRRTTTTSAAAAAAATAVARSAKRGGRDLPRPHVSEPGSPEPAGPPDAGVRGGRGGGREGGGENPANLRVHGDAELLPGAAVDVLGGAGGHHGHARVPGLHVPPASLPVFPVTFIMLLAPVYDHVVVPFARRVTKTEMGISHLQRIGAGLVLSIVAMAVAALVEVKRKSVARRTGMVDSKEPLPITFFWLAPQYLFLGSADLFTLTGLLEFFFSEAPGRMRSLATSLSWASLAMGYYLSSVLVSVVNTVTSGGAGRARPWLAGSNLNHYRLERFYWLMCALSVVNFCHFLFWAGRYRYRRTDQSVKLATGGGRNEGIMASN